MSEPPRRFDLSGLGLLDDIPPAEIVCGELVLRVRPFEALTAVEHGTVKIAGEMLDRLTAVGLLTGEQGKELQAAADHLLAVLLQNPDDVPTLGLMQRVGLVRMAMSVAQQSAAAGAEIKKKWAKENLSGSSTPASSPPAATRAPASRTGSRRSRSRS